ncbi:hypothetical protein ES708_19302 [subsurface metagenome]
MTVNIAGSCVWHFMKNPENISVKTPANQAVYQRSRKE